MPEVAEALSPPVLDHVVINVMDGLDSSLAAYERLGFQMTERGHHSLGSANHLAIFDTNYLELLGYEPGRQTSRADLWKHPAGLTGLVFKGTAPEARYADLVARGVAVEPPAEFVRPVDLPGGAQEAKFRTLRVASGVENGRTFFCYHYTPHLVWRSEWQVHPNRVTSIREFVIASTDPARTAAIYGRMFGTEILEPVAGGIAFKAGAATVLVLTPDVIESRFGQKVVLGVEDSDRMVALVSATAAPEETAAVLAANGVPVKAIAGGGLSVAREYGANVISVFVPEAA